SLSDGELSPTEGSGFSAASLPVARSMAKTLAGLCVTVHARPLMKKRVAHASPSMVRRAMTDTDAVPCAGLDRADMRRSSLIAAGMLLVCCSVAFGLNPALAVSQYAHTSWKVRDGVFKGSIYAVAQTLDGYLWLGTEFGLVRFDGVRAIAWQPSGN